MRPRRQSIRSSLLTHVFEALDLEIRPRAKKAKAKALAGQAGFQA